jgi:hypothetical protein
MRTKIELKNNWNKIMRNKIEKKKIKKEQLKEWGPKLDKK